MPNQQAYSQTPVEEFYGVWAHDGFNHHTKVPHGCVLEIADFPATFTDANGYTNIPSGTLVGRTYAERDAYQGFGPADVAADDQIYLITEAIVDAEDDRNHETGLYRHTNMVYEDQLPGWATFSQDEKDKVRELYECIVSPEE